jgi:hypothetical protein
MRHPSFRLNRRAWLQLGAFGTLGLSLPRLLRADKAGRSAPAARSCVLFLLHGGPSQLDTWDMKPNAPAEVRGEFRPIATRVPGMQIVEHLPRLAGMATANPNPMSAAPRRFPIRLPRSLWIGLAAVVLVVVAVGLNSAFPPPRQPGYNSGMSDHGNPIFALWGRLC